MSNTFTQIHIQAVFAVQNRDSLISNKWDQQLYQYIGEIIKIKDTNLFRLTGRQITFISSLVGVLLNRYPT